MEAATCCCSGGDAVTVWKLSTTRGDLPVYLFRMEGGTLSHEQRTEVLDFYRDTVAKEEAYASVYDMTDGIANFMEHLVPFAEFCNSVRPITKDRLRFTVVVCPNAAYRTFLSLILSLAPTPAPLHLVKSRHEVPGALDNAAAALL